MNGLQLEVVLCCAMLNGLLTLIAAIESVIFLNAIFVSDEFFEITSLRVLKIRKLVTAINRGVRTYSRNAAMAFSTPSTGVTGSKASIN